MESTVDAASVIAINTNWHRSMQSHSHGDTGRVPHSHCPYCGNVVGESTASCAKCDHTFLASVR